MIVNLKPYAIDAQPPKCAAYGKVRLDESKLYWKNGLRWYGVELAKARRTYRQVENVYGKLCCGGRSYVIHRLVLVLEDGVKLTIHIGDDEKQAAQDLLAAIEKGFPHVAIGKE